MGCMVLNFAPVILIDDFITAQANRNVLTEDQPDSGICHHIGPKNLLSDTVEDAESNLIVCRG